MHRAPRSAIIAVVLFALGKHLLVREAGRGGWVVIAAWLERWWRSR